jgi:hypothetical protein
MRSPPLKDLFAAAAMLLGDPPVGRVGLVVNNRTQKMAVNPLTRLASRSVMRASYSVAAR